MIILRDSSPVPADLKNAALAIGNFDGLHLGHRAVIAQAVTLAKQDKVPAGLLTFEPHPRSVLRPDEETTRILSFHEKMRRLKSLGLAFVRIIRFTPAFSHMTAEQFVQDILLKNLRVSQVVTGEDFIFGHNRDGNAAYLRKAGAKWSFAATACKPVLQNGERCSSTGLRALLKAGKVSEAGRLMGEPYFIEGRVKRGERRGRELGFPTANLVPAGLFLPARGVYAVRAKLQGREVGGVANLGMRPTFSGDEVRLETHFFDWQGDLYGQRIRVPLLHRIREERKFPGVEALKEQIKKDCERARALLG